MRDAELSPAALSPSLRFWVRSGTRAAGDARTHAELPPQVGAAGSAHGMGRVLLREVQGSCLQG